MKKILIIIGNNQQHQVILKLEVILCINFCNEIAQQQASLVDSKVNVKRDSVTTTSHHSLHSNNVSPTEKSSSPLQEVNKSTWPIIVRLSNNGQDITISVPTQPPYLTVAGLREALLPHLEKEARVRLIYLGRILPDQHIIVPTETTDDDIPLPPPKKRSILIQKEGVIQAMITKKS